MEAVPAQASEFEQALESEYTSQPVSQLAEPVQAWVSRQAVVQARGPVSPQGVCP
jgi:hypothetical protein